MFNESIDNGEMIDENSRNLSKCKTERTKEGIKQNSNKSKQFDKY
jgi:hypothetical protein